MKIWEIELSKETVGKKYTCSNGSVYVVEQIMKDTYDLACSDGDSITASEFLSDLFKYNFEEVVDWSQVPIDTKVLTSENKHGDWKKRYFAGCENGRPTGWFAGSASWSETTRSSWSYMKLADE